MHCVRCSIIDQTNDWGCVQAVYPSELCQHAAYAHTHHPVCCICLDFAHLSSLILLFYSCVVQSHCFSIMSFHHSLMCVFVLFCSAPSSLLLLLFLLLHPVWLPVPGAFFFLFSAVPVPPPPGVNIEEHIQIRQEEKRQRINRRHRLEEGRGMDQGAGRCLRKGCVCFFWIYGVKMIEN